MVFKYHNVVLEYQYVNFYLKTTSLMIFRMTSCCSICLPKHILFLYSQHSWTAFANAHCITLLLQPFLLQIETININSSVQPFGSWGSPTHLKILFLISCIFWQLKNKCSCIPNNLQKQQSLLEISGNKVKMHQSFLCR